jgi:hypothetical protein
MLPESYRPSVPGHSEAKQAKTWPKGENQYHPILMGLSYQVTVNQKSQNMAKKPKSMLPESYLPFVPGHSELKRVKRWPRSQNQYYPSFIGLAYRLTVSQNESKHGQEAKINTTRVLSAFPTGSQWAKTSQKMAKKPKSMLPESYRPFVPGHREPKWVKSWPRRENQCYPSLIGLSYQVTVSQNESKHGQEAKINTTRLLSAFRTSTQWAKTSQNVAKNPKSILPEFYRPFVPAHSEPKRLKTWPISENQYYPSFIDLSYQHTVSQNE